MSLGMDELGGRAVDAGEASTDQGSGGSRAADVGKAKAPSDLRDGQWSVMPRSASGRKGITAASVNETARFSMS
jgi:hypothetical protein